MCCLVKRQLKMLDNYDDEEKKALYMKEALSIIANMKNGESAPVAVKRLDGLFFEYFNEKFSFEEEKRKYNDLILQREDEILERINSFRNSSHNSSHNSSQGDRLLAALKFSRIGNYIDFGALQSVEDSTLSSLIDSAPDDDFNMTEYENFKRDVQNAKRMCILTDNCGEIVFDKIFVKVLREEYPSLDIKVIVRGFPVLNDATYSDAVYVGIDRYAEVVSNGSAVAGNYLPDISKEALALIDSSDLLLAKGQGNFETMFGCGRNIYYAFLCKCEWFVRRFGMKRLEGVFVNELRKPFSVQSSTL